MAGIDRFMAVFSSNVFCSNGDACQKMQKVSWGRRWEGEERGWREEASVGGEEGQREKRLTLTLA